MPTSLAPCPRDGTSAHLETDIGQLVRTAGALSPPSVVVRACNISACRQEPLPQESQYIVHAVEKRRKEFVAGRSCARGALATLGLAPRVIPVGRFGEPVWPESVVASLTHSGDYCVVAAAHSSSLRGIGIDLTQNAEVGSEVVDLVLTSEERTALAARLDGEASPLSVVFCIKESVYKCLFPLVRQVFDFRDVAVDLDVRKRQASVRLLNEQLFKGIDVRPSCTFCDWNGYTFSTVWLPNSSASAADLAAYQ